EVLRGTTTPRGNLQPVFETLLANATRLCDGNYGAMWLWEGDAFRVAALHGELPPAYIERWRSGTVFRPGAGVALPRAIRYRFLSSRSPVSVAYSPCRCCVRTSSWASSLSIGRKSGRS